MHVPEYFKKDLELINPRYFAFFDERSGTWSIRKWNTIYPRLRTQENDSILVCEVKFPHLDNRILMSLRRGIYWAAKAKELVQSIDQDNARIYESAEKEDEYIARYMAKSIYHYYREPTVIGGVQSSNRKHPY